ncbi:MAG: HAD family hydrolase [Chloroflexi bacterium]|nr:HAD family hydrolase [Chloroflexota bacterium]
MTKPDTILFDLGHTLVDFRAVKEDLVEVYGEVRDRLVDAGLAAALPSVEEMAGHLPKKVGDIINDSYKMPAALEELEMSGVVAQAFASIGLELPQELVEEMVLLEHKTLSRSIVLSDDAAPVLAQLKQWGFRIGLVSNATNLPELLRRDLDRLGILDYFDATAFSSEVGLRKPHPAIYDSALKGIGAEPERTVFVGDRIREDIRGPQALGMRAVLTHQFRQENPDGSRPDKVINHVREILEFARHLGAK